MSQSPAQRDSVELVHHYLAEEIQLARAQLSPKEWPTILVGVSDQGDVAASPCRLILPFHYPASIEQLDEYPRDHFAFPEEWPMRPLAVGEFAEQYEKFAVLDDPAESIRASDQHRRRRIEVLQDACSSFDPALTIFGIESDTETWWEVNTFPISGPPIPPPPPPISDAQLLARLCRHQHSYVGKNRFHIEGGAITEVNFDGGDTNDATIDLLRAVPNLSHLLRNLKKMSLESTLVTDRSLSFLKRELPHVEIAYSSY